MKLTISDYKELNRLIHRDQGRLKPRFSAIFLADWNDGRNEYARGYGAIQYFEIEKPEPIAEPAPRDDSDDVPF